jgi:hypothetical protein
LPCGFKLTAEQAAAAWEIAARAASYISLQVGGGVDWCGATRELAYGRLNLLVASALLVFLPLPKEISDWCGATRELARRRFNLLVAATPLVLLTLPKEISDWCGASRELAYGRLDFFGVQRALKFGANASANLLRYCQKGIKAGPCPCRVNVQENP